MVSDNIYAIILAAGEGKRMKSSKAKVLHKVGGKEMVKWVRDAALKAGVKECCAVIGHGAEQVRECLADSVSYAVQKEQRGTGDAVKSASDFIKNHSDGHIMILCGDVPLITSDSIKQITEYHINSKNDATIVTTDFENPKGYGRIFRDESGKFSAIVEDRDCNAEQKLIKECNSGIYCFRGDLLLASLEKLECNNSQKEYYLTDVPMIIRNNGHKVGTYKLENNTETLGVNDRIQLAEAGKILRRTYCRRAVP
jgi:bifunctional UDP-N-acetylglucosamine pyrophosphorylase/glucosamine-1-phosphate N-acetyltransferase